MIKNRIELAKYFNKMGFSVGAEIGVADGYYSEILCQEIPELKLYSIDLGKPYNNSGRTQNSQDKAYSQACKKLTKYNVEIRKQSSVEASLEINNLDFVFIDGCHTFDNVMLDIILGSNNVKKGGIVSGHDYCHFTKSGVIEAVNKYTEIHKIELNLTPRNKKGYKDDRQPCWWFIK